MKLLTLTTGILLHSFLLSNCYALNPLLVPVNTTTQMRVNPIGLDSPSPVFGWTLESKPSNARNLRQTSYRILVASSTKLFAKQIGDLWDSGRIHSSTYWQIPYTGSPLHAHTRYYWQVQVWNGRESPGAWSRPGQFTTGMLSREDWSAHWIAAEPDRAPYVQPREHQDHLLAKEPPPLPVFHHDFTLKINVVSALLYVCGLGQYEVNLNGRNVTDTVMNPGWTHYTTTIAYDSYDVTKLVHSGANAFGVLLGNGMYNVEGSANHYYKFTGSYGHPKLLLQMEVQYSDGSSERIISDQSWLNHTGPLVYSSIYGGESFDARALPLRWNQPWKHVDDQSEVDTKNWQPSIEVRSPGGQLRASQSAPIEIAEEYQAVRITHPQLNVTIYDLGNNMSGWPAIRVRGEAGSQISLLAGELLDESGNVTQLSTKATSTNAVLFNYTLRGGPTAEEWHPRFSYYSFRYVQATTNPATPGGSQPKIISLRGQFVHAHADEVGHFSSSDKLLNRIHTLIDRAVLSNLASVITDCPSREKLGWLEQTYLNASTLMLNYDVSGLYKKISRDMADSQLSNGLVPNIAPEYVAFVDKDGNSTDFRDSPEWSSAVILSPWALYQLTGDRRPLDDIYEEMKRYISYLGTRSSGGLLDYGLGDWYDIGPRSPGESQLTAKLVTATGTYYEDLCVLAQIATLLGHTKDASSFIQHANQVKDAFNRKLFHPESDQYDRHSQTANALALALGLVPPGHERAVLDNLVKDIRTHSDHVTSGDIGFHYVVRALTDYGRSDVLAAMLSRSDSPSYGYQLAKGATTLTETWDAQPDNSQNHFMLGHADEWFYRGLAGLTFDLSWGPDDAIRLAPSLLKGIDSASASYNSPMGVVSIAWKRSATSAMIDVTVPAGAQASLTLPASYTWQGNALAADDPLASSKADLKDIHLRLGSGTYRFLSKKFSEQ